MATKNGATFLQEQVDSILPQLRPEDEIVISDDCSGDDTLNVIRTIHDPRIRLLQCDSEMGIARNFEISINASRGDYIFLADQDDVWLPDKVKMMKYALQQYDLVMSDCHLVDDRLNILQRSFYRINRSGQGFLRNLFRNSYMGCCMAFTKRLKERVLPFPPDIPMHDFWIGLVAELHFRVHFMPDVLVLHRRHGGNASTSGGLSRHPIRHRFMQRCRMLKNLLIHKHYVE